MHWRDEIVELHQFFEDWFLGRGGEATKTEGVDRADRAFHPDFTFIGPDGVVADRATTLQRIADGYAHTTELTIETVDHRLVHPGSASAGGTIVATYIERHRLSEGRANERISTAVFVVDPDGPNGLRWLHVHETWLDRPPPTDR